MLNLSPFKIMIIVAVILIFLGPDKLPQAARQIGQGWRQLKQFQQKVETEVRDAIPSLPSSSDLARVVRSPVNLLNELADRAAEPAKDETEEPVDPHAVFGAPEESDEEPTTYQPPVAPPDASWN
mgnify:CR=1 FL=1